jgi:hypothetical protein
MAWIKVETNTPDKQKIRNIARICGISRADTFLAWFTLWSWFDMETEDGYIQGLKPSDCDDVCGVPGFGAALKEVGWVEFSDDGGYIMRWERHNGESAKKRATDAQRKADKKRAKA